MKLRHAIRRTTTRAVGLATAAVLALAGLTTDVRTSTDAPRTRRSSGTAIASTAIFAPPPAGTGQPPHSSVLSMAMVQGAVYDAVNAIDGSYTPYLVAPPADPGDSKEAAAATAAFRVLVGFPTATPPLTGVAASQLATLQPLYEATLGSVPDGPAKQGGIEVGEAAATAMLQARQGDGRFVPVRVRAGHRSRGLAARTTAGSCGNRRRGSRPPGSGSSARSSSPTSRCCGPTGRTTSGARSTRRTSPRSSGSAR